MRTRVSRTGWAAAFLALATAGAGVQVAACASLDGLAGGGAPAADGALPDTTMPDTALPQDAGADTACAPGDLQSDPSNCGACGRSCLGGGCEAGVCLPMTIANGFVAPGNLAIDDASLYFTENGKTLRRMDKDGGGVTVLATEPSGMGGVTTSDTQVYWTGSGNGGNLRRASKVDGSGAQTLASNQGSLLLSVVLDATHAYYTARGAGMVMRIALSGVSPPEPLVSGDLAPTALQVDATNFYWTTVDVAGTNGKVSAQRKDLSGPPVTMVMGLSIPGSMGSDANSVYWADYKAGNVRGIGKPGIGGSGITLATNQNGPLAVSVDATYVYWGNFVGESVFRSVKGVGSPQPIAVAQTPITGLVNDDCCIYWIARGSGSAADGKVLKLAK